MDNIDEEDSLDLSVGKDPIDVGVEKYVMEITRIHKVNEEENKSRRNGLCLKSSIWLKSKIKCKNSNTVYYVIVVTILEI